MIHRTGGPCSYDSTELTSLPQVFTQIHIVPKKFEPSSVSRVSCTCFLFCDEVNHPVINTKSGSYAPCLEPIQKRAGLPSGTLADTSRCLVVLSCWPIKSVHCVKPMRKRCSYLNAMLLVKTGARYHNSRLWTFLLWHCLHKESAISIDSNGMCVVAEEIRERAANRFIHKWKCTS